MKHESYKKNRISVCGAYKAFSRDGINATISDAQIRMVRSQLTKKSGLEEVLSDLKNEDPKKVQSVLKKISKMTTEKEDKEEKKRMIGVRKR